MRFSLSSLALAGSASAGALMGFNSGSTKDDGSIKVKADWTAEFSTASNLKGSPGDFNAVRLYTNIQGGTETDPIEAFQAAMDTKTKMLLGIWTSGTDNIDNELTALKNAVKQYGSKFTDLVVGISIGSEDLYRNSVTGIKNKAGIGADPDVVLGFIKDYQNAVKGTSLADAPIGHVDTWDAWTNGTNQPVIDAIDWVGVDEYPFYETTKDNDVDNAPSLFDAAYDKTVAVVGGKDVWVTETGWPATGPKSGAAVASNDAAAYYWQEVGCGRLFNKVNTFWYTLRDSNPANKVKFAITDDLSTTPRYNLTCSGQYDTVGGDSSSKKNKGNGDKDQGSDSDKTDKSDNSGNSGNSGDQSSSKDASTDKSDSSDSSKDTTSDKTPDSSKDSSSDSTESDSESDSKSTSNSNTDSDSDSDSADTDSKDDSKDAQDNTTDSSDDQDSSSDSDSTSSSSSSSTSDADSDSEDDDPDSAAASVKLSVTALVGAVFAVGFALF